MLVGDDLSLRGNASLLEQPGSAVSANDLFLRASTAPAGDGTLIVDGAGSTFSVNGASQLGSGGGSGTLTVYNGATADFNGGLGLAGPLLPRRKKISIRKRIRV